MKPKQALWAQLYRSSLCNYLENGVAADLKKVRLLGAQGFAAGLQTLDIAKLHEETLLRDTLPGLSPLERRQVIAKAGRFFSESIVLANLEGSHPELAPGHRNRIVEMLSQRTIALAASNLELEREVTQRKSAEKALKKNEQHYSHLLKQSERLQDQLRRLSREILSAQEDERKRISRELHDVIAQTLTGINVRLASLKKDAATNTKGLDRNIARTQRLVEKSVNIVHRFARELRPAVLDDLGLIPALESFLKAFSSRTGIKTHLTAFAAIDSLDTDRRTALYRVAQEALTNVARHARATHVRILFEKLPQGVVMKVHDDGKSFQADRVMHSRRIQHLGLLGMRERLEMVGGRFTIQSKPGAGTTIEAQIPWSGRSPKSISSP